METLSFSYSGGTASPHVASPVIAGVVGSGNLEVLIEPAPLSGGCTVDVVTAAAGFGEIWRAVLDAFFERYAPAGLRISINDMGATPATVSLRLDQAMASFTAGAQ